MHQTMTMLCLVMLGQVRFEDGELGLLQMPDDEGTGGGRDHDRGVRGGRSGPDGGPEVMGVGRAGDVLGTRWGRAGDVQRICSEVCACGVLQVCRQ